jgi:hypothetical protein
MFYPIGGSVYEIHDNSFGFIFKCNLPPVGYGLNSMTGEVQKTDILPRRSEIDEECYWERYILPPDFKARRKIEKERQKYDKHYFDPELELIRGQEWNRRLCGVWFHNYNPKTKQVELTYITGTHYLYATYWKFQGKNMDFRINDMECWYVAKYMETDPNCRGLNEITKRKLGKTARLGCWIYERTSRMKNSHSSLQSKTDDDAWEVFKKAIVAGWKALPDFFRPIYDTNKGDDPNDELRFFHPSKRGKDIDDDDKEPSLESWIDYKSASDMAEDGAELDTYGSDESGKVKKPHSIMERQSIVRFCSEIDGQFLHRKQWFTTTVEIDEDSKGNLEADNYEFQELTNMSNPLERDDNGRTMSGLYTYFLPAYKGMFFDKYGYPDEERAKTYLLNTRRKLESEGQLRELSSFKRKNPMTFKEAFSADGSQSLYNPELLNNQLDEISWTNELTEFGDLVWKDGNRIKKSIVRADGSISFEPSEVEWMPNPKGRFERVKGWQPKKANDVYYRAGSFRPNNNFAFRIGCDPFRYDKTKEKRRSNCAAFAYQMEDAAFPNDFFSDMFVLRYAFRAESTRESNEDVLKMAWYCGCQVLFERNVNHWKNDFIDWECAAFLMMLPDEVEHGVISAGGSVQTICNYTEAYINKHIKKVYFKTLLRKETGWLGFKVEDTEKFDEPMGAGVTLIAVRGKSYGKPAGERTDISNYFKKRQIR